MSTGHLTPKDVAERFEEAARTLRRLPEADRPQAYFNTWPAFVRTTWEILAMEPRPMRVWATPQAVSRMEEALAWLFWLAPDQARLVWMRAEGQRWKPICHRLGVSRATAWRWWAEAIYLVAHRANEEAEKGRPSRARRANIRAHSDA